MCNAALSQGPVVRKPFNANPILKINLGVKQTLLNVVNILQNFN